jgi:glycopeptide antibiotics resistance protein
MPERQAWQRSWAEFGIVFGTLPWTWMGFASAGEGVRGVILIPVLDLVQQVRFNGEFAFYEITSNLMFMLPFGALAPLRWPSMASLARVTLVAAAYSGAIEFLQYALGLGRVSSVDDVLVNAVGALLGAGLTMRWWRITSSYGNAAGPGIRPA